MSESQEAANWPELEARVESLQEGYESKSRVRLRLPEPQATALLSRILASLHETDVPVVQIVQVSESSTSSFVAQSLAKASIACLGRTLLVGLSNALNPAVTMGSEHLADLTSIQLQTKTSLIDRNDIMPDRTVSGLYHARIGPILPKVRMTSHLPPTEWLGKARSAFQFLIIDCGSLPQNPTAVELASRCHITILTVLAGQTSFQEIRSASRQLGLAGGRLLGTTMLDSDSLHSRKTGSKSILQSPSGKSACEYC